MGQVFTVNDICCGRIPRLGDFPLVIQEVREAVMMEDSIVGALVCGSIIRGDHTIRSDIDLFVLYDEKRQHDAFRFMQMAALTAARRHIPLTCIPCDTLLAKTGMHHCGSSFLCHLQRSVAAGGLLKGDPLKEFADSLPEKEDLKSYLRVKMYTLQESWGVSLTFSGERLAVYLKKLLEAPMHIARKTLAYQGVLGDDSKTYIRSRYRQVMPRTMSDRLEQLIALDTQYTNELITQSNHPDKRTYQRILKSILLESGEVLEFVRANLLFVEAAQ